MVAMSPNATVPLLTFYYKYCTSRCLAQKKNLIVNVKPNFFTIFLIFHVINTFFGGLYGLFITENQGGFFFQSVLT